MTYLESAGSGGCSSLGFSNKKCKKDVKTQFPPPVSMQTMLLHDNHLFLITQTMDWIGSYHRKETVYQKNIRQTIVHLLVKWR